MGVEAHAIHVRPDRAPPLLRRNLPQGAKGASCARIVHQEVDRPELLFRLALLLDSRVLRDQELNECRQQRFASLADVVHELEEPQVNREFLLGNAPMRTQPTA